MNLNPAALPSRASIPFVFLLALTVSSLCGAQPAETDALPETLAIPDHSIEARTLVEPERIISGESFRYSLQITWEGSQLWVNLDPPEVFWPEGVALEDVRTRSASRSGPDGPVGEKVFVYDLAAEKSGRIRLPDFDLPILFLDGSTHTVSAPGREIVVEVRPTPASAKIREAILENLWIVVGLIVLAGAGGFFFVRSRGAGGSEEHPPEDPWAPFEESLKRCEALQKSGRTREFYEEIEAMTLEACRISTGRTERKLEGHLADPGLSEAVRNDLAPLASEIEERKYRPDRPRPEEAQRTFKQARAILAALQEFHKGKVS